jgi:hypothetical protein
MLPVFWECGDEAERSCRYHGTHEIVFVESKKAVIPLRFIPALHNRQFRVSVVEEEFFAAEERPIDVFDGGSVVFLSCVFEG